MVLVALDGDERPDRSASADLEILLDAMKCPGWTALRPRRIKADTTADIRCCL
jgi:hypothetical protein